MIIKGTMIFAHTTNVTNPDAELHRTGGWTEHVYFDGVDVAAFKRAFLGGQFADADVAGLCSVRAALLPQGSAIVGQRWQGVNPVGPAQSQGRVFVGTAGLQADVPQMALLYSAPGVGVRNVRRIILRGIPDARVVMGEYSGAFDYNQALVRWGNWMGNFSFRARDLDAARVDVLDIDVNGNVNTAQNPPFAVDSKVQIGRTRQSPGGKTVTGVFLVESVGPGNKFKVKQWPYGVTLGGYARQYTIIYPRIDSTNTVLNRVVVKKVGRPFVQYRGRRSKRR